MDQQITTSDHRGSAQVDESRPRAVLLVGPTAVGKTELALQLAEKLGAEIISVDSRLFYRGMDIGTAKPTAQERARIRHHLVDIADPDETLSLATFQQMAHEAIGASLSRGRLPLLVGGTGQYVRAITAGWLPPRVRPQERLRAELQRLTSQRGKHWLHEKLHVLDPDAAASIDARNVRRTIRALEVILSTGRRFSEQRSHGESPYRLATVGLSRPRAELYARIDARIDAMWSQGLLDETRRLVDQGYNAQLPSMTAIGYAQCLKVLRGELDPEQARTEMRRATRAFLRRQSNWFKESDPEIRWYYAGQPEVVDLIARFIGEALKWQTGPKR